MKLSSCWKTGLLLGLSLAAVRVPAAPLQRDLGLNLAYLRVHALPADLPAPGAVGKRPCVLDIRFVHGGRADGAMLLAWLKAQAGARTPVFLLANRSTSGALLSPLDSADAVVGLVILGPAAKDFAPDIALPVTPEVDRRAYDALEKGASLDSLVVETLDKPRDDEAALARSHLSDGDADVAAPASTPAAQSPPLIDVVLQRAIQLHRSLLALKRIPGATP
jgi:hypothetical protein